MGVNSKTNKKEDKNVGGKSSWNDNFQSFMVHGPGADGGQTANQNFKSENNIHHSRAAFIPQNNDGDGEEKIEEEKSEDKRDGEGKDEDENNNQEDVKENKRLYIMNLPYTVQNEELQTHFGKFGEIEKIEIPLRKGGQGQAMGIAFINFLEIEGAITAFANLD